MATEPPTWPRRLGDLGARTSRSWPISRVSPGRARLQHPHVSTLRRSALQARLDRGLGESGIRVETGSDW